MTVAVDQVGRGADDPARRFADLVKLTGWQAKFIGRAQEQKLLEEGVREFGLGLDQARGIVRSVAEENHYTFETETTRRIQQVMARQAGRRGMISRKQFDRTAQVLRDFSNSTISDVEARKQLKQVMIDNGWRPRRAGLLRTRRWYRSIEV